jgi:hypothetical protein
MTMKRIALLLLIAAVSSAVACTSSNTVTSGSTGSSSYDSEYRDQTRGSQSYGQQQGEIDGRPEEDPPVTIMLLSMETGDVYPGDDYYIYAVVDNVDDRDLEYVWSIGNGDVQEVPEAERGRLATVVETEYNTAAPAQPAAAEPAATAEGQAPGTEQPAPVPGTQATPGATTTPGTATTPQTQASPPGSSLPGEEPAVTAPAEEGLFGGPSGGGQESTGDQFQDTSLPDNSEQTVIDVPNTAESGSPEEYFGERWPEIEQLINMANEGRQGEMTQEQQNLLNEFYQKYEPGRFVRPDEGGVVTAPEGGQAYIHETMLGIVTEKRVVAAEDADDADVTSENVIELAAQLAEGINSQAPAEESTEAGRDEPAGAANVVDEANPAHDGWVGTESTSSAPGRGGGLRSQYQVWKDDATEPRKRLLGGYSGSGAEEPLLLEESYELSSFVTDEPYIMWTPRTPGPVNIYFRARYKDEYVTDPAKLEVEVRLRDPDVALSEGFPDVLREDDPLYIALEATNIPEFNKGLITLTFDPNRLSFRDADLGDFFDDSPAASLFYAQPDKTEGKVLLAMDANTMITELGGNGDLAYIKFTAKQDLASREDSQLALVLDTSARYILNYDGENVLPLPVESPVYRTTTTMPPELPEYNRERYPGTEAGTLPGTQPQAPAAGTVPVTPGQPQTPASQQTGTQTQPVTSGSSPGIEFGDSTRGTTPATSTPADTTPGDTTPGDTTPGDTTPGGTTPGDTTPIVIPPGSTPPGGLNREGEVSSTTEEDTEAGEAGAEGAEASDDTTASDDEEATAAADEEEATAEPEPEPEPETGSG